MSAPNKRFIKYHTDPPSPKQAWKFQSMTGVELPADICTKGGAGLAIAELVNANAIATSIGTKLNVNVVTLPAGCFVRDFTETGLPKLATIVDKKYAKGVTIEQLREAGNALAKVKKAKVAEKVNGAVTVKRGHIATTEVPDAFNEVIVVRRYR